MKKFMGNLFSGENGELSSKKVFGGFIIVVALTCVCFDVFKNGLDHEAVDLLNTAMILGATLLGLTSITGIWKSNAFKVTDNTQCPPKSDQLPSEFQTKSPTDKDIKPTS